MENNSIKYMDICRMLKRYSFEEKVRVCNCHSRMLMSITGDIDVKQIIGKVYPWELETFFLLSIKATPEYNNENFLGKNIKIFNKMINGIRNFIHPSLMKKYANNTFTDYYIVATGLTQFDIQESFYYKLYRYNYIFNFVNENINMPKEFVKVFNTIYREYLDFGSYLIMLYGSQLQLNDKLLNYFVMDKYPNVSKNLSIDLENYKIELEKITSNVEDYITCLRPSYKYPFIKRDNQLYFPLPHLLGRSITSAMLYRMTDGNNALREKIGKEVLENYLIKILKESKAYDEVHSEKIFKKEHNCEAKTLDAMAKTKDDYILLDCKSAVPLIGLRTYNDNSYEKEIFKLVEKIEQIYKHLRIFLPKYKTYNPFKGALNIDKKHLWGITVVLEDSYIRRNIIYEKVAQKLNIKTTSDEYIWMTTHIKIASMYDIERFSFCGRSLIDGFLEQISKGNVGDYAFSEYSIEKYDIINSDYEKFMSERKNKFQQLNEELLNEKLF